MGDPFPESSRHRPGSRTPRVGSTDLNNDGNTRNDIVPGTVCNQFRLPNYRALDLRITRRFPLAGRTSIEPVFKAYNLLNSDNINSVDTAFYGVNLTTGVLTPQASFGQPLATAGQRILQLAFGVTFSPDPKYGFS
jgi:hypothetical protein